ncbi:MAG: DUF6134 family protein [Pseudomonadota bacterium]
MLLSDRRRFLAGAAASALIAPGIARAAQGRLAFDILRDGNPIGTHVLSFDRAGDRLETTIAIDILVKIAFVPVYRYTHRNREVYDGDQLVSMASETDDNGSAYRVNVRQDSAGLLVDGSSGVATVPAATLPTTYWKPRTVQETRWIDTQRGSIIEGRSTLVGTETVLVGNEAVACERYALRGDLDLDLWYGSVGWAKLGFQIQGNDITYRRRPESDVASLPQAVLSGRS